jgi:hypothetical protein
LIIKNTLEREYINDAQEYQIDKKMLNLITDMGYIIKDKEGEAIKGSRK